MTRPPQPADNEAAGATTHGTGSGAEVRTPATDVDRQGRRVDVHVHVHLAVAGTFPLRVSDLLFTDDRLLVPEYEYLTPLFGIAGGRLSTVGASARERYGAAGVAGLLADAERTREVEYDRLTGIRVYEGGRLGRPKVAVDLASGPPLGFRVHAPVDCGRLRAALAGLGDRRGFAVRAVDGIGFSPTTSVRRFLADR